MPENFWPEAEPFVPDATFADGAIPVHAEYQRDPIGWARDKLGISEATLRWGVHPAYGSHTWDGTPDPIATAMEAIADGKDVAIESGTGTGKSFGAAIVILWFLACFTDAEVYTFALTEDQLKLYIWKNITELWPRFQPHFPTAELTSLTLRMRGGINETWSAHGLPVQIKAGEAVSSRAAGKHAEHMLLVFEEMAGMDRAIAEAGKNTCTAPHNLRWGHGNPNNHLDTLHRMTEEPGVVAIRASSLDHPNVVCRNPSIVPGAVSQVSIDKRLAEYGEQDPIYQSRVRGFSPEQAANALFRKAWLDASASRFALRLLPESTNPVPGLVTGKGVDAANSEHGDEASICDFAGNCMVRLDAFPCPDSNVLGATVVREARKQGLPPNRVAVDAIGVGAGTVNEARRLGFVVQALYAGGKPMTMIEKAEDGRTVEWSPDVNQFDNLRSQMLWQLRLDFQNNAIDVPKDDELWQELLAHTFAEPAKTEVASKDEVKKVIGRSPNKSDSTMMANWVRVRIVTPLVTDTAEGVSMGWSYKHNRPSQRESADDYMQKLLNGGRQDPTVGRYFTPRRNVR